jgi:hypothetical protein
MYLKCCPIVLETPFIKTLAHYMEGLPLSIVKSWSHACTLDACTLDACTLDACTLDACTLDACTLDARSFDTKYLRLSYYVTAIKNSAL